MRIALFEKLNPTVKAIVIIACCIIMAIGSSWEINCAVIVLCLLSLILFSRCNIKTMLSLYLPLLFLGGLIFLSNLASYKLDETSKQIYEMASFGTALLLGTRIISYASFGVLFGLTTQNNEFTMSLMHQMHLKPKFAYGVMAALHLVPTLAREWDEVKLAYAVRRKKTGIIPFKPLFNTLVNGIRWSENVAMAMESKGFDGDGDRTFYVETPVRTMDIIFSVIYVLAMVVFLILFK